MGIIINDKTYSTLCRQGRKIRSAKNNRDKLYESITEDIIKMYSNTLSKTEVHTAARNLIEFYRILLE